MNINFKAKLLIFTLSVVLIPTVVLVFFFIGNFNAITRFSLEQNKAGIERLNQEFLNNLAADKARLISLQFKRAIDGITILGKTAQKLIDNYDYQFKFVVDSVNDLPEIQDTLDKLGNVDLQKVMLMPQAATKDELLAKSPMVAEMCKMMGLAFSQRLQILLWDNFAELIQCEGQVEAVFA